VPMQVHNLAAMLLHEVRLLEKFPVILVRHETDFHALLLVGGPELAMPRDFARVALGLFAEWEHGARELVLPQRKKKVALILLQIAPALEEMAPREFGRDALLRVLADRQVSPTSRVRGKFNPREMAGGDELRAELVRAINQPAKLQILIAQHAGIRRAAGFVFVGEVTNDVLLEFCRLVNQVIRDAELVADGTRVGDGLRAAAFVLGAVHAILRPELERDADDLITLLQQQRGGSGGVHSTAHADDDALTLLRIHRRTLYNVRAACKMVCEG
jgi:hypothetical protein